MVVVEGQIGNPSSTMFDTIENISYGYVVLHIYVTTYDGLAK